LRLKFGSSSSEVTIDWQLEKTKLVSFAGAAAIRLCVLLADAGVPMIFVTLPGMVLLLIPIIIAEAVFVVVVRCTSLQKTKGADP
jgi:hypothetical protein